MRVGIATPYLVFNADAVGLDTLGMRDVLAAAGHEVRLFTAFAQPEIHGGTYPITEAPGYLASPEDVIIYHHSTGWPEGVAALQGSRCRRVVRYHNVTPPHFFSEFAQQYRKSCEAGVGETRLLAALPCDLYLCDSNFNRSELVQLGCDESRCAVVPPFNQLDRFALYAPDEAFTARMCNGDFIVLTVGRVVPNKGHETLLQAFSTFHHEVDEHSRLLVVGLTHPEFASYHRKLLERARELDVGDAVEFPGSVTEPELKAAYLAADLFAMPSLHEGFCVPVVEAMSAKVPIVASRAAALPETVADCGLLFDPGDAGDLSEAIRRIALDGTLVSTLTMRGLQRQRRLYSTPAIAKRFNDALATIA